MIPQITVIEENKGLEGGGGPDRVIGCRMSSCLIWYVSDLRWMPALFLCNRFGSAG